MDSKKIQNTHFQSTILTFLCEINPLFLDNLDFYRAITYLNGKV